MATMEVRILGLRDWEIYLSQQANTGSGFEPPLPEEADQPVDSDILQDLSDDEIDEVANLGSAWQVSAGTLLGQAGEQADRLFIILKGEARLSYQTQIGEVAVRIAKPGDSFPLAALLGSGGTITTGQALTDYERVRYTPYPVYRALYRCAQHRYVRLQGCGEVIR